MNSCSLSALVRRAGGVVPVPLLDAATWATPTLGPLTRMAVCTAVRRGYAEAVCRHWRRAPRAMVPHFSPPGGGGGGGGGGGDGGGDGGSGGGGDSSGGGGDDDDICDAADDDGDGVAAAAPLRVVARVPVAGAAAAVASAMWG